MNPWKLTPAEVRSLQDFITRGSIGSAAFLRGLSPDTVHEHFAQIRKKMRTNREPKPTSARCAILFDRWQRGTHDKT